MSKKKTPHFGAQRKVTPKNGRRSAPIQYLNNNYKFVAELTLPKEISGRACGVAFLPKFVVNISTKQGSRKFAEGTRDIIGLSAALFSQPLQIAMIARPTDLSANATPRPWLEFPTGRPPGDKYFIFLNIESARYVSIFGRAAFRYFARQPMRGQCEKTTQNIFYAHKEL